MGWDYFWAAGIVAKIKEERLAKVEAQLKWEEKHKDELSHKDNQMPF